MQEVHYVFRVALASVFGWCKDGSNNITGGWFQFGVFEDQAIPAKSTKSYFQPLKKIPQ